MFIVLEGKVGAFRHDERTGGLELNPFVEFRPGEIVGELAFTLHRPRTATLLAVEDVSLLAVHAGELKKQAERIPHLAASLERFLTGRIVEYVCNSVPYLIGREQTGPLVDVARRKNWDSIVEHAEKIACPLADARPITMEDARFAGNGLYVLVSGSLRSKEFPDKVFSGDNLPLIYVDLPGRMVCPNHVYIPEGNDVVFLRIGQDAFLGRKPVINDLVVHVRHQLPQLYRYDVFLSHTFDDRDEAVRWHDALTAAGLRVYMEHPTTGKYFRDHIQAAILDSLALLALVSANTMVRPIEQNWVRREIAFRKNVFEADYARILPTRLRGGQPEKLAEGYTVIESIGREEAAIAEVIAAVCRIKQSEPPFARARKIGILISES